MFFIPGFIISFITFPGVIVHELAHQLFCRYFNVPVFKVVYFQTENPNGYVLHEVPANKWHNLIIAIGPFILNTILAILLALPASIAVFLYQDHNPLNYLLLYLAFSIAMHAFPSTGDAQSIWEIVNNDETNVLVKIVSYPIVGLIYICSIGSMFWLDAIYAFLLIRYIPEFIFSMI